MSILTAFNDHFFEFVNAIQEIRVDDSETKKIRMSLCIESSHIDKVSEIISDLLGDSLPYELIKVSVSNIFYVIQ
jgi:hypothetical protein